MGIYTFAGSQYAIVYRPGVFDREIIDEVVTNDTYRLWAWKLAPGSSVVDIGAHIGSFSVLCALKIPGAHIVSVEMDPGNYSLLSSNVARLAGIKALNVACCGEVKPAGYRLGGTNSGGNRVCWQDAPGLQKLPDCMTLSQVLDAGGLKTVDLLKMDCEGAEHGILRLAAQDGTLAKVRRIAAEYHAFFPGDSLASLQSLLVNSGYSTEVAPICPISGIIYAIRR